MKQKKKLTLILLSLLLLMSLLTGCSLLDFTPKEFTEGVMVNNNYPDDVLELYDNGIVFESDAHFDDVQLSIGTNDGLNYIADFYKTIIKNNNIEPLEEKEDEGEYYVNFEFGGYEFKIKIEKPVGKYEEKLFSYVIYISSKEADEKIQNITPTATMHATRRPAQETPTPTPPPTKAPTNAPANTPIPTTNDDSITLTSLDPGSWYLVYATEFGDEIICDLTIYIDDGYFMNGDDFGILYYYNIAKDIRWYDPFLYTIDDGILYLNFYNDDPKSFEATLDDGVLSLVDVNEPEYSFYLINTEAFPNAEKFTAYGSWFYYQVDDGFSDAISFHEDGTGYIYNWFDNNELLKMTWSYKNSYFHIYGVGDEYVDFEMTHMGHVLQYYSDDGDVYFYNRPVVQLLNGTYYMDYTTEKDLVEWSITFNTDYTCDSYVKTSTNERNLNSSWDVDMDTGRLIIDFNNDGDYNTYSYHYSFEGLVLIDETNGLYYELYTVG